MIEHWVDRIRLYGSVQVHENHVTALLHELDCLNVSYSVRFDQGSNLWNVEKI